MAIRSRPTRRPASSSLMLRSCPLSALVDGVKIGSGSRSASRSPAGSAIPQTAPVFRYSAQPGPGEIARARRTRSGPASCAGPASTGPRSTSACRRRTGGEVSRVDRAHVIGHDVARVVEPEGRQLRQHLSLVGNARPEHVVERRDAVGRDDEQVLPGIVEVADLAAAKRQRVRESDVARRARGSVIGGSSPGGHGTRRMAAAGNRGAVMLPACSGPTPQGREAARRPRITSRLAGQ